MTGDITKLKALIEDDKSERYNKSRWFKPIKGKPVTFEFMPQSHELIYHTYQHSGKKQTTKMYLFDCILHDVELTTDAKHGLWDEPKRFKEIGLYTNSIDKILKEAERLNIDLEKPELVLKVYGMIVTHGKLSHSCKFDKVEDITV